MGEALRPLRDAGVLIMGSGSSFHSIPEVPSVASAWWRLDGHFVGVCTGVLGAACGCVASFWPTLSSAVAAAW